MKEYVVTFYKTVLGGRGVEFEACQWTGNVEATDEAAAIVAGAMRFCERDHLARWSAHADRVHVSERSADDARSRSH